jgi:hypothetical protein
MAELPRLDATQSHGLAPRPRHGAEASHEDATLHIARKITVEQNTRRRCRKASAFFFEITLVNFQ